MEAVRVYIMLTIPMVWVCGNWTTGNMTDPDSLPSSDAGLPMDVVRNVPSPNARLVSEKAVEKHLENITSNNVTPRFHIGVTKRDISGYDDIVTQYKENENATGSGVGYSNSQSAITDDFDSNRTVEYIQVVGLCGYPPYNDRKACLEQNYFNDALGKCEMRWAKIIFGICTGLAAAAIICVNILIPVVVARCPDMRTHYDFIKGIVYVIL